jgi:hypothetical protein
MKNLVSVTLVSFAFSAWGQAPSLGYLEGKNTYGKVVEQRYLPTTQDIQEIKAGWISNQTKRAKMVKDKQTADSKIFVSVQNYFDKLALNPKLTAKGKHAVTDLTQKIGQKISEFNRETDSMTAFFSPGSEYENLLNEILNYLDKVQKRASGIGDPDLREGFLLKAQKDLQANYGPRWYHVIQEFSYIAGYVYGYGRTLPSISITPYLKLEAGPCEFTKSFDVWPVFSHVKETEKVLTGRNNKYDPLVVSCEEHSSCGGLICSDYDPTYYSLSNSMTVHTYMKTGWGYYRVTTDLYEILPLLK